MQKQETRYRLLHGSLSYAVIRKLGEGGMTIILEASHVCLRRRVAIKMPLPGVDGSKDAAVARVLRQANLLDELWHVPGIVRALDVGQLADGTPYLVMDLVEGENLRARQLREISLGWASIAVTRRIAEIMVEVHALGVVHRDLKPSNVMIGRDGSMVIIDWDIARRIDDKEPLTCQGVVAYTAGFSPPEQLAGGPPSPAMDVYALGGILYLLIAGSLPGEGKKPPPPPGRRSAGDGTRRMEALPCWVPDELRQLLGRMRAFHAAERPSMSEVVAALRHLEEPKTTAEPAAGVTRRVGLVVACALVLLAISAGAVALHLRPRLASAPPPERSQPTGDGADSLLTPPALPESPGQPEIQTQEQMRDDPASQEAPRPQETTASADGPDPNAPQASRGPGRRRAPARMEAPRREGALSQASVRPEDAECQASSRHEGSVGQAPPRPDAPVYRATPYLPTVITQQAHSRRGQP